MTRAVAIVARWRAHGHSEKTGLGAFLGYRFGSRLDSLRFVAVEPDRSDGGLEVTCTAMAGVTVIRAAGDMCDDGSAALRRVIAGELVCPPDVLVLDLTEISCIDAVGVDALHLAAELTAEGDIGLCVVARAGGVVMAGLDATGSANTFEMFTSVIEALRDLP